MSIKDNDEYELGSDDEVNDVVPDGKVKMFVKKAQQQPIVQANQPNVNIPQSPQQNPHIIQQPQVQVQSSPSLVAIQPPQPIQSTAS